jgi:hypothetical protein
MIQDQRGSGKNAKPLWISKRKRKQEKYCRYEKLISDTYRKHEIIVFFKKSPTQEEIDIVKESFKEYGIAAKAIRVKQCDNCDIPVLLFQADNIHTTISGEGVRAGSGPPSTTVGEEYSLNFFNQSPFDRRDVHEYRSGRSEYVPKKENIIVAVIDTGLDTKLVDPHYVWTGSPRDNNPGCYKNVSTGWNFINDTADFTDDDPKRHGTVISQYIINQFQKSPENSVQIMPLKTHDKNGVGDLFNIICAIHFAMAKGANMINASWGFYYYFKEPIPYLKELITEILPKHGILFVTAAGNQIDAEEIIAQQIYLSENGVSMTADQLRDLAIHNFYPAHLSTKKNSVITVTTTNGQIVSASQNYSSEFADLGVKADKEIPGHMQFQLPFAGSSDFIGGSSFATAIATGLIGAFCEKSLFVPGLEKKKFLKKLKDIGNLTLEMPLKPRLIKDGAMAKKVN